MAAFDGDDGAPSPRRRSEFQVGVGVRAADPEITDDDADRIRGMDAALQLRPDLSVTAVAAMLRPMHSDFKDRFLDALRKVGLPE